MVQWLRVHLVTAGDPDLRTNIPHVTEQLGPVLQLGFPGGAVVKNLPANTGDVCWVPGSGRSLKENGNPLQYSCLESPMDRGAWWSTVHGVAKSWTQGREGCN